VCVCGGGWGICAARLSLLRAMAAESPEAALVVKELEVGADRLKATTGCTADKMKVIEAIIEAEGDMDAAASMLLDSEARRRR
jgi:hypothetical protein